MPTIELHGQIIGASPLAQWLVLPPLALYLARRSPPRDTALRAAPHAEMHRPHRKYGDQGDAADYGEHGEDEVACRTGASRFTRR